MFGECGEIIPNPIEGIASRKGKAVRSKRGCGTSVKSFHEAVRYVEECCRDFGSKVMPF
jgi:hypothetical protein